VGLLASGNSAGAYVVSLAIVNWVDETRCHEATVALDGQLTVDVGTAPVVVWPLVEPVVFTPQADRMRASVASTPNPAMAARGPRTDAASLVVNGMITIS